MVSLTNGSGIDQSADPTDPSTWVFDGGAYQDEWMASYMGPGVALNNKLAWSTYDLGSTKPLIKLWLFNTSYAAGVSGVASYNLYYADTPGMALPAQPTKGQSSSTGMSPQGDYDFNAGGWTLVNTSGPLSLGQNTIESVGLSGINARYP